MIIKLHECSDDSFYSVDFISTVKEIATDIDVYNDLDNFIDMDLDSYHRIIADITDEIRRFADIVNDIGETITWNNLYFHVENVVEYIY